MFGKMEVCSGGGGDVRVLANGWRGRARMTSVGGSFGGLLSLCLTKIEMCARMEE